jgi:uncharacterized membrane protein YeaQ/YmgE (transglycosylase-associated protein family)
VSSVKGFLCIFSEPSSSASSLASAKVLTPGRDPGGFITTTLLGIAGALVAKYIGVAMGFYQNTDPVGFIASVIGAIILLALYHLIFRSGASRTVKLVSGHTRCV